MVLENPDQVTLQGWLKIRITKKGKKNKFEWAKKYAVVRSGRFYLCDREKDKDNMTAMEPAFDLR
jgi:hypothetical protein